MERKLITIMSNCYNEEVNVDEFYDRVVSELEKFHDRYDYEIVFIDNCSTDRTVEKIKTIIDRDKNVRLIVNARNFGQVRSPYHGLLQTHGDAVISMATDMQDPPSVIPALIDKWEEGHKNVIGIKTSTKEGPVISLARRFYYQLLAGVSETEQIKNFTGFGLYDRQFLEIMRSVDDPNPYFRGMVTEFGLPYARVPYEQPPRTKGRSKNTFFTLYDLAMLGFVNHTRFPLRLASFVGFVVAGLSLATALGYFVYKLFAWNSFRMGTAPLVIGVFTFSGVQLFFLGIIGEYLGTILTRVRRRPHVVELERINFDR